MNVVSLQASSEHFKPNSLDSGGDSISKYATLTGSSEESIKLNAAATKMQSTFRGFASRTTAKNENSVQDIFHQFFGVSPEEYSAQCKKNEEIRRERELTLLSNPEAYKANQIAKKAASDAADAQFIRIYANTKFNEENVQEILKAAPYLTAKELHKQLGKSDENFSLATKLTIQRDKDKAEAVRRRAIHEAAGHIDPRPLIDRMVIHANLNEAQEMKIESYKNLSLQEIESILRGANLSLEELENRCKSTADDGVAPKDRDAYINICKEIYKSKKRDEFIKTYKDHTIDEMCSEINESYKTTPMSEFFREILCDVGQLKSRVEMMDYVDQHHGHFNENDFIASRRAGTATVPTWAKCNTEQELKAAIDQKSQQMRQEQAVIKDAVTKIEESFKRFLNRKARLNT